MIEHVYARAALAPRIRRVIVATDDERIRAAVAAFGGEVVMTSPAHATGTDRLAEVAATLDCDIIVNVQGDEPLLAPEMIGQALTPLLADATLQMSSLRSRIVDAREYHDPNVVKVVVDVRDRALYFSRAPIPHRRDQPMTGTPPPVWRHIGVYAYRRAFLPVFAALPQTPLEQAERLEQLRALEHGFAIAVPETCHEAIGVDTPADLDRVEALMRAMTLPGQRA